MAVEIIIDSVARKLSPKVRRAFLSGKRNTIHGLVEVSPTADSQALASSFRELGAQIRSWTQQAHVVSLDIPVQHLREIASLDDVLYVGGEEYLGR